MFLGIGDAGDIHLGFWAVDCTLNLYSITSLPNSLSIVLVHIIPSPLPTVLPSPPLQSRPSSPSLLMQILHLPDRRPLRFPNRLSQHHHLLLLDHILGQLLPQRGLDALPKLYIVLRHEAQALACFSCPGRPAYAMDVGFAVCGQVVVDDYVDGGYVEAPGRHVRGDQNVPRARAEFAQSSEAGGLRELAVEWYCGEAECTGKYGESLGFVDGSGEDDGLESGVLLEEVDEVQVLLLLREEELMGGRVSSECGFEQDR